MDLVNFVATVLLEVTTNMAQKRNIAESSRDEQQERTGEDENSECGGNGKGVCDKIVMLEVL